MSTVAEKTKEEIARDELSISNREIYDKQISKGKNHQQAMSEIFASWLP